MLDGAVNITLTSNDSLLIRYETTHQMMSKVELAPWLNDHGQNTITCTNNITGADFVLFSLHAVFPTIPCRSVLRLADDVYNVTRPVRQISNFAATFDIANTSIYNNLNGFPQDACIIVAFKYIYATDTNVVRL